MVREFTVLGKVMWTVKIKLSPDNCYYVGLLERLQSWQKICGQNITQNKKLPEGSLYIND